jgi:uncharacterized protein
MPLVASEFNTFTSSYFPDTWLLYNSLTGSLRTVAALDRETIQSALSHPDLASPDVVKDLYDLGFLTDLHDERAEVVRRYFAARQAATHLSLTISPTVACNFRCTYCFEQHPSRTMSTADSEAIAALVRSRGLPGGSVSVAWFGGEPLLAFPALKRTYEAVTREAQLLGAEFSHSIITNGYLLSGERLDWLAETKVRSVQVTIDGARQTHDSRRPMAGGKGTYDTIMSNLEVASRRIPISLRINVDRRNCGDLEGMVEELVSRGLTSLSPYLGHVTGYSEECGDLSPFSLTNEEFAHLTLEFRLHLIRRGFAAYPSLPKPKPGAICTADSPNGVMVSPGGVVVGCWNEAAYSAAEAGARLQADGTIESRADSLHERWLAYNPFGHTECKSCRVQPLCKGGCPWESQRRPEVGPGSCTPLRWTLEEELRLYHLSQSLSSTTTMESQHEVA